ncbi:hypothetical protein ElyMa_006069500 [Elysia marginata]|uniref:Uncharacterized protein n=1 Tax=Elysia marginata TaxID=1093978 RepID=A0AAV4GNR7_9GAST|nr:hypothetical protein ElyMa_006069500 [Elysia marginata]
MRLEWPAATFSPAHTGFLFISTDWSSVVVCDVYPSEATSSQLVSTDSGLKLEVQGSGALRFAGRLALEAAFHG